MPHSALLFQPPATQLGPEWQELGTSGYWSTLTNMEDEVSFARAVDSLQGHNDALRMPADFLATRRKKYLDDRSGKSNFEEAEDQAQVIFEQLTVPHRLTLVTGSPGAAKTTVAAHWVKLARAYNSYLPIILITAEKEALLRMQEKMGEAVPDMTLTLDEAIAQVKPWPKYACVMIDEAGLIDTKSMATLLVQAVDAQAARVILIGDDKQLLPKGTGQPFRWLRENKKAQLIELLNSYRQKTPFLREAIRDFYSGDAASALNRIVPSFLMADNILPTLERKLHEVNPEKTLVIVHGEDTLRQSIAAIIPGLRVFGLAEAQGLAFDHVLFVISGKIDLAAMLVGCSRQRFALDVYVDENIYANRSELLRDLAQWQKTLMALDILSAANLSQIIDQ